MRRARIRVTWVTVLFIVVALSSSITGCNEDGTKTANTSPSPSPFPTPPHDKYNFVVILTDDQRWDTMWAMPIEQDKLGTRGVIFSNAFVSAPLCTPSRASFLAGGFYAKNTGVLQNVVPNGGAPSFRDDKSLPTLLQRAGYKTGLFGKYLNGYPLMAPYVPPGWTEFLGYVTPDIAYNNYKIVKGRSAETATEGEVFGPISEYLTNYLQDEALRFIEENKSSPFFFLFTPLAPHLPAKPADRDVGLFADYVYRDRAYGEEDLTDKPASVQELGSTLKVQENALHYDRQWGKQLESLQAVDRAIEAIFDKIDQLGMLNQTVFFISSDNGLLWGEHGIVGKTAPYEESIRVPLLVVLPGVAARTEGQVCVANLDTPATILDLAGIDRKGDGLSLVTLLKNPDASWREEFLIENYGVRNYNTRNFGIWAGLRTQKATEQWKYVEHATGERELYDLINDPYEEENKSDDPSYSDKVQELATRLDRVKGLVILDAEVPPATVGEKYSHQMRAWGGTEPYVWTVSEGQLPGGLELDTITGLISGTPTKAQSRKLSILVKDNSVSPYHGDSQSFSVNLTFVVNKSVSALTTYYHRYSRTDTELDEVIYESSSSGEQRNTADTSNDRAPQQQPTEASSTEGGLAILNDSLPPGQVSQEYNYQLHATGGTKPYHWNVVSKRLPEGIKLNAESGFLQGVPLKAQESSVSIQVEDSSVGPLEDAHQRHARDLKFVITDPGQPVFTAGESSPSN